MAVAILMKTMIGSSDTGCPAVAGHDDVEYDDMGRSVL
ncbi:MAG: hypothetical protein OJF62_001521 [Pseudolabrys sp.]|jgi:hypothetical protein|nr:hypothetical protein [Pseudolabrys sp.]